MAVSALLALCSIVIDPVDHAAEFTEPKIKAKRKRQRVFKPRILKPFFSPLWDTTDVYRGKCVTSIKFEDGMRFKLCPRCEKWKPSDTEHFHINKPAKIGLSSLCRKCRNKSQCKS